MATIKRHLSICGLLAHRPSSPALATALEGRHVVAFTGHRWDKLGGYQSEVEAIQKAEEGSVQAFTGIFGFLNNFAETPFTFEGLRYKTAEAAFQAAKTCNQAARRKIAAAKTPKEAKALAYDLIGKSKDKAPLRSDWDNVRADVMKSVLRAKFESSLALQNKLMATAGRDLQHGNAHGDVFWGLVKGAGSNKLGLILSALRTEYLQKYEGVIPNAQEILHAAMKQRVAALKAIHGDKLLMVSGFALGVDLTGAEVCRELEVDYIAALPFPKQPSRWPQASQKQWESLLRDAHTIVCVGSDDLADADIRAAMQWRNEWMVDNANEVLALWDGSKGGTGNCVAYADEAGKRVQNMHEDWQELYRTGGKIAETLPAGKVIQTSDGEAKILRLEDIATGPHKGQWYVTHLTQPTEEAQTKRLHIRFDGSAQEVLYRANRRYEVLQ